MLDVPTLRERFTTHYGAEPKLIVRAPGRVNLLGEHTDYNDGFVFPAAIDRATYVAAGNRDDAQIVVYSGQFKVTDSFGLAAIERSAAHPWSNYVRGVVRGLLARGDTLKGANLLIESDVPLGSGLSSSAALEVATGYAFQLLNDIEIMGEELALLAQAAENTFVGVQCGIMDQFISALGREGHALMIDCRDLSYEAVPLPAAARIVICNSGVHHSLGDSGYNQRRAECNEAVRILREFKPTVKALRDVTLADLQAHGAALPPLILARARHVVSENQRVLDGLTALRSGDLQAFGALMTASHISQRDDYAVSVPEIDLLVDIALAQPGCYGSRLTGGGFGGSTVSMVATEYVEAFTAALAREYQARGEHEATILVCRAIEGVKRAGLS
ncbi:galactokinase [Candidatus Gracilibacteria bacterium]|nr:galactokinase [Candidatus Gracilibacteria bacterium]